MKEAIIAEEITKTYRIGVGRARIREMMPWPFDDMAQRLFPRWWAKDTFNALENVSFAVETGESVGLVGHNGAGKTTMLKVLAGVTAPNAGHVQTKGRTGALIDVLVGFHPDLTGRENTYLMGAIYGFSRNDMRARLDRILEFAEIDELADTPLKRYSTGMMARLGFGIVSSLDMDVLLVDEVLSVGDASFQRKCVQWLQNFASDGGTLIFISHNLSLVRSMTSRVIWLDHGKVAADGPTGDVLTRYAQHMEQRHANTSIGRMRRVGGEMRRRGLHRWGAGGAELEQVHLDSHQENGMRRWEINIAYRVEGSREGAFTLGFLDESGRELGGALSPTMSLPGGRVTCVIDPIPFRSGIFFPVVSIVSPDGVVRDRWQLDKALIVEGRSEELASDGLGPVDVRASWTRSNSHPDSISIDKENL